MQRYLNALVLVLSLHFGLADAYAAAPSDSWTKADMNPLPVGAGKNDKQIKNISCGTGCRFNLHYFQGRNIFQVDPIFFSSQVGPDRLPSAF